MLFSRKKTHTWMLSYYVGISLGWLVLVLWCFFLLFSFLGQHLYFQFGCSRTARTAVCWDALGQHPIALAWLLQAAINMYPILFGRIWLCVLWIKKTRKLPHLKCHPLLNESNHWNSNTLCTLFNESNSIFLSPHCHYACGCVRRTTPSVCDSRRRSQTLGWCSCRRPRGRC